MRARNEFDPGRGIPYTRSMGVTVKRPPGLPQRLVACPECGVDVGMACISSTGKKNSPSHASRKRLSIRAERDRLENTQPTDQEVK